MRAYNMNVVGEFKATVDYGRLNFNLLPLNHSQNIEDVIALAETVTFFNDMCCMAPATLIDERIQWTGNNGDSVFAKFINNNIEINATLVFNNKNELVNFISDDRYTITESGSMKKIRWSTPLKNYQVFNGCKLASSAETIYSYPDKDLIYGTFQLKSIEYNVTSN